MPRRLLHIPRHALKAIALAAILSVVLFFALTRTQVGRDGLRRQIEAQFADDFEGRLEIGQLTGNLVQDLFATDVRLVDPDGQVVLEVDSLVARPRWRDLLSRRISVRALTLIRPTIHLVYEADGAWNLADVFRRHVPRQADASARWAFESARIEVDGGTVLTEHEEEVPSLVARGWLFDITDSGAFDVNLQATVEWGPTHRLVDILEVTAVVPDVGLDVEALRGQFLWEPDRVVVSELALQAGATEVFGSVAVVRAEGPAELDLTLRPSRFDLDELRRVVPKLQAAGEIAGALRLHGPVDRLVLEDLDVQRGRSHLRAEATLLGLPDSLNYEMAVRNSALAAADIEALLPEVTFPPLQHLGLVTVQLDASGRMRGWTSATPWRVQTDTELDLRGLPGAVRGTASVECAEAEACRYAWDLAVDSLDVGRLAQKEGLASRLQGRVEGTGSGSRLDSLDATVTADLARSELASRRIDSLHVEGTIRDLRTRLTGFAEGAAGRVFASGTLNFNANQPHYNLGLITRDLDLGRLFRHDAVETRLNTQWSLDGAGWTPEALRGEMAVRFEASTVRAGGRTRAVPPHETTLRVAPKTAATPRVYVTGDVLDLRLEGTTDASPLQSLARLWSTALDQMIRERLHKRYDPVATDLKTMGRVSEDSTQVNRARAALAEAGLAHVVLRGAATLKRGDILAALVPVLPEVQGALHTDLVLTADADRLALTGSVMADSLALPGLRMDNLRLDLGTTVHAYAEALMLDAHARADSLHLARQTIAAPDVVVTLEEGVGVVTVAAARHEQAGPLRLSAGLEVLPDRYRVALNEMYLALGDYEWVQAGTPQLDLYTDAVVVPSLALESRADAAEPVQRLRLRGAVSDLPLDTLYAEVEQIGLRQLSDFVGLKRTLGGRLNGQVALTGTIQPELTGGVRVENLAFDGRWLGQLTASSRYVPGLPDVALDVWLTPQGMALADSLGLDPTENQVRMTGTFRLPSASGGDQDAGALDLRAVIDRADAFFFENIFSNVVAEVEGAFSGEGRIRGTFDTPLFEANLALADGRFDVPRFGLRYEAAGPITVDEEGIHLQNVVIEDPTGGQALLRGGILFNEYRYFSFDLAGSLAELQIMDVLSSRDLPFFGQIWASGNATLTGPLQNATLRTSDAVTSAQSEVFIPLIETEVVVDPGFIVFADSTGQVPEAEQPQRRANILSDRPVSERTFLDGLEMDLNIFAPQGSTVHLVIDPLLGDVINAVGSGRIQLQRQEGEFSTFGTLDVSGGDYLFTAGEVFVRRFLIEGGTITWDGDPLNARLNLDAAYRTRASRAGLPPEISRQLQSLIPVIVDLHITGRVATPQVDLRLAVDRSTQEPITDAQFLEAYLNQPDRAAQHATSVLVTNTFLLSAENLESDIAGSAAFNSVSQLVSSQLNRYLSQVLPNADFTFGVQQGDETTQDLDVTAGLALRLLNERLVIRGQGIYRGVRPSDDVGADAQQGLQGEFVVEVRLNSNVSVEVFYRRESDVLSESLLMSTTGAGLSYQTRFPTWRAFIDRLFGTEDAAAEADSTRDEVVEVQNP